MRYVLVSILFMCLYGPRLKILDLMFFSCLFFAVLNLVRFVLLWKVPKYLLLFFGYLLLVFMWFSIHFIYFGTGDYTFLGFIAKYVVYACAADFIVSLYFRTYREKAFDMLVMDIVTVTSVNAI